MTPFVLNVQNRQIYRDGETRAMIAKEHRCSFGLIKLILVMVA